MKEAGMGKSEMKIRFRVNDMPLYRKLLLLFGISLGIEFIVVVMTMGVIGNAYNELLYEQIDSTMSFFTGNLETALNETEELSFNMISDQVIQKEMDAISGASRSDYTESVARSKLEERLMRSLFEEGNLMTMSLIQDGKLIVSVGKSKSADIYEELGLLGEGDSDLGNKVWICVPEDYSLLYVRRIRKIENLSLRELGYLIIRIDFCKMISESIDARYQEEDRYMLSIRREDETLYSTLKSADLNGDDNWGNGYRVMDVDGSRMFVTYNNIKKYGWDIFYGISYSKIFHSVTRVWIAVAFVLCLIFLMAGIICNRGITQILWHFKYLERKIERFKENRVSTFEPKIYDYRERRDEIALIHRSFDEMTMEIERLIQENYAKQLVIKDAKIKILEQQMNPHFLYNMLQTIEWRAKLSDRETTAAIINTLGSFLHNTMKDNPEKVTMRQELEIVHDYIELIKARYEDEITFQMDIDEECLETIVPRMTIQPLVENAVYYGISESQEEILVNIEAVRKENVVMISVRNTGSEIDEHILEHLESGEVVANGNGIGLRNIQERLNLTYGAQYGLQFSSGNQATVVTVRIPFKREEE